MNPTTPEAHNNRMHLLKMKQAVGASLTESEQEQVRRGLWLWSESAPGVFVTAPVTPPSVAEWMAMAQRENDKNRRDFSNS
ncbi:MAG: hypothetical protein ACF8MJ_01065 [Phycisphaerales bacterium JB050]